MSWLCLCQYEKCPKSNSCERFLDKGNEFSSYAEFQNICNEQNGYEYYSKVDLEIIKKDKGGDNQ